MRSTRFLPLLLLALAGTGCASSTLTMQLQGDAVLDQTAGKQSRAVIVHVCLLKSDQEFRKLTRESLSSGLNDGKTVDELLAGTAARTNIYTIAAGTQPLTLEFKDLTADVTHVGLIALFNNPSENWQWLGTLSEARGRSFYLKGHDLLPEEPEEPAAEAVKPETQTKD